MRGSAGRWAAAALLLGFAPAAAQAPATARGDADTALAGRPGDRAGRSAPAPSAAATAQSFQRGGPTAAAAASDTLDRPALEGMQGGGEAGPLCRAQCAPAFYTCVSTSVGNGGCDQALAVCRRGCDAAEPAYGRLQSPLPAAGLAAAGPLRPLPGGLPPPR